MFHLLVQFLRYYVTAFSLFVREPTFRALALAALAALFTGTVFYHFAEDWTWVDSLYFSTVTLASVGYGDFTPTSEFSRLFTILYIVFGLGIIAGFFGTLMRAPMMMEAGRIPHLPLEVSVAPPKRRHIRRRRTRPAPRRRRYVVTHNTPDGAGTPADNPTNR